jgi:hypothetical protein
MKTKSKMFYAKFCVTLMALSLVFPCMTLAWFIPDTGQTKCYNAMTIEPIAKLENFT